MTRWLLEFALSQSITDISFVGLWSLMALTIAAFTWWFCGFVMWSWNRRFRFRFIHHIFCGFAALITLISLYLYRCVGELNGFALKRIAVWQEQYVKDLAYSRETFLLCRAAVKTLYTANGWAFADSAPTPVGKPEAMEIVSKRICDRTISHFTRSEPVLSKILSKDAQFDYYSMREKIDLYFHDHPLETYPPDKGALNAGHLFGKKLNGVVAQYIPRLRRELLGLFVISQIIAFSLAGYSAYADLKLRSR